MTAKPGAHAYKQTGIKTATRGQLLIMLYEAAIQHLRKATAAIDAKDSAAKGLAIGKAHDILNELMNTLNHEVGGEISQNLERLYAFMIEQLIAANTAGMSEDAKVKFQTIQKLLETLLEGWRVAVAQAKI